MSSTLWGKEALCALDTGEATYRSFGAGIVILDPEGKIIWKGGDPTKGSYFYQGPGAPPVPYEDLKKHIEPHLKKGLLGGLSIPAQAKPVADALKAGDLAGAQARLVALGTSGPAGDFRKEIQGRLEDLRKRKLELFDELSKAGKSWEAFKVGQSYVRCFPKAEDLSKVKGAVSTLQSNAEVKQNLTAKQNFVMITSQAYGSKAKAGSSTQAAPAIGQIAKRYAETEFGRYASDLAK
jgi:hypothetical protein